MAKILPKVSIITPSYNQGQFIEATIQSVLKQTYPNIEYIVVDGGSTDSTMSVVERYKDRIDIVIHEKDKGQSDAINKGFKLATGDLIGWLNSDDILYPDCVSEIVRTYNAKPDGAIYYNSTIDIIDKEGLLIKKYTNDIPHKEFLLKNRYSVCQQGSFYSRESLIKVGYIDEKIHYCMDLDLWLKLLNHGSIYSVGNNSYAALREWETTKTATGGAKFLSEIRKVLQKNGAKSWHESVRRTYWYETKIKLRSTLKIS